MKTLAKPAAKKTAAKVVRRAKSADRSVRLVPPPGRPAREVMADYPAPSPNFDAEGVERIIACRSER